MVLGSNLVAVTYVLDNALVPIREFLDVQATSDSLSTGMWHDKKHTFKKSISFFFYRISLLTNRLAKTLLNHC